MAELGGPARGELEGADREHYDLLRRAGINTYEQLSAARSFPLFAKLAAYKAFSTTRASLPRPRTIDHWVHQAYHFSGPLPGQEDLDVR